MCQLFSFPQVHKRAAECINALNILEKINFGKCPQNLLEDHFCLQQLKVQPKMCDGSGHGVNLLSSGKRVYITIYGILFSHVYTLTCCYLGQTRLEQSCSCWAFVWWGDGCNNAGERQALQVSKTNEYVLYEYVLSAD